ncbi:MAG: 4Fe-4S binding protein [Thermoplasmata archaeon]
MRLIKPYRILFQLVFIFLSMLGFLFTTTGLIYPYFFCYANPFSIGACPIGLLEHSCTDITTKTEHSISLLLYLIGFLGFVGLLGGRIFCGWACPIGTLQDAVWWLRNKVSGNKNRLDCVMDKGNPITGPSTPLKYIKYGILILIPLLSLITGKLIYTHYDPVGFITGTILQFIVAPDSYTLTGKGYVKMVLTLLMLILVFTVAMGWCRFFCPIGAAMGFTNRISFLQLRRKSDSKCISCGICARVCRMGVDPAKESGNMECTLCGRCIDSCPKNDLVYTYLGKEIGISADKESDGKTLSPDSDGNEIIEQCLNQGDLTKESTSAVQEEEPLKVSGESEFRTKFEK